jgi:hypothetical protein
MGFLAVIIGVAATFAFGAFWYGVFSDPWNADSKVPLENESLARSRCFWSRE